MEAYTQKNEGNRYLWPALAVLATIFLCWVPYLHISRSILPFETEELTESAGMLTEFFLRAILVVPLLMVTPALWARSAWSVHPFTLGAFTVLAFLTGLISGGSALEGLYSVLFIAPAGVLLYLMQKAGYSNFRIVFYGSILTLIGLFARISLPTMIQNGDAFLPLRNLVAAYEVQWEAVLSWAAEGTGDQMQAASLIRETLSELRVYPEISMLQLLYYPSAAAGLSNGLLSHVFNRKGGAMLKKLPAFEDWQVESGYFYGTLALTVVAYALSMSGASYGMGLLQTAYVIWLLPMSLAGLCAIRRWTKSKTWLFIMICVMTGVMYSFAGQILAVVGMLSFMQHRMRRRMQGEDQ